MAAQYRIVIQQGSTYDQTFLFKNKLTNTPIDFTGYSSRMQLRTSYDAASASISLDEGSGMTTGGDDGTIRIEMTPTQTAALPAATYVSMLAWLHE